MLHRFGLSLVCALAALVPVSATAVNQPPADGNSQTAAEAPKAADPKVNKSDEGVTPEASESKIPAPPVDTSLVVEAGAKTRGGLVPGMRIVRVTSLEDNGPGTLRAALRKTCPCVIIFDVGGVIELKDNLRVSSPHTTIAGQTAPYPGIFIRGHKLRIAASDVVVQHISISPVNSALEVGGSIDAIGVATCSDCAPKLTGVRFENITAFWSTDEIIGLWGDGVASLTVRNSLIAEALDRAGHPKGTHSMGLLIGGKVEGVEVTGNLFASNKWRNPVIGSGASAYVANNFVYNPGLAAQHVYGDFTDRLTRATFIGNVVKKGPSSDLLMRAVALPTVFEPSSERAKVALEDNHCCSGEVGKPEQHSGSIIVDKPPVVPSGWNPLPAEHVWAWVSRNAGARPRERSAFETRILDYIKSGSGKIINSPKEVGGHPAIKPSEHPAEVPKAPFLPPTPKVLAETRLEAWLCLRHLEVGGPLTAECPDDEAKLTAALLASRPKK